MQLGSVHHVTSLDQAFDLWAAAMFHGAPLPTFTTTTEDWPTVLEDIKHSYTVEYTDEQQKVHRWQGVMIHVTAVNPHPPT
jgi:hypothetical protein